MNMPTNERFWNKVIITQDNKCWTWSSTHASNKNFPYGVFWNGKRTVQAHRHSFELANGPIPDGLIVRHTCDNPSCVNPNHLLVGTYADNSKDMLERKRMPKGEKRKNSKLTESNVREIRQKHENNKSIRELSKEYKVSDMTVRAVIIGKTWKHVT